MPFAPIPAVPPHQHMPTGWVQVAQRLADLGVTVTHTQMDHRFVADLNEEARTLAVRSDADPDDQVWGMQQACNWLDDGATGSPTARSQPLLHVVHEQHSTTPPS